jgi:plastocyanin
MKRPLLVLVGLALVFAGCGSSSSSSSPSSASSATSSSASTAAPSGGVAVTMKNLAFLPKVTHAKVGQAVMWTNNDTAAHNVTYVSGPKFASSSTLSPGATFKITASAPGTIKYYCTIHPFMTASIVVSK